MFVLDNDNVKVYSYNHPRSPNTSLSDITIDGNSIPSFFPAGNSFEHGVAHDTPQVTIAATALHPQASVAITPTDAETRYRRPPGGPLRRPQRRHHHGHR